MLNDRSVVWDAGGRVWAQCRVAAFAEPSAGREERCMAALLTALGTLGCEARLSWDARPHGPGETGALFLTLEVGVGRGGGTETRRGAVRSVAEAAAATVLRPFGLGRVHPSRRLAEAQHAAADRLAAGLAPFRLLGTTAEEIRAALDDGVCGWREARCCGYLVGTSSSGGRLPCEPQDPHGRRLYRACFVALPAAGSWGGWPLEGLPRAVWTMYLRPSRRGPVVALLARCEADNLVDLGEQAAALRGAVTGQGWDLVRPGSGQALLDASMAPMAPRPAGRRRRRLPGRVFFPLTASQPPSAASRRVTSSVPVPIPHSVGTEGQA